MSRRRPEQHINPSQHVLFIQPARCPQNKVPRCRAKGFCNHETSACAAQSEQGVPAVAGAAFPALCLGCADPELPERSGATLTNRIQELRNAVPPSLSLSQGEERGHSSFHPISGLTLQQEYPGAQESHPNPAQVPFLDTKNTLPKTCQVFLIPQLLQALLPRPGLAGNSLNWDQPGVPSTAGPSLT